MDLNALKKQHNMIMNMHFYYLPLFIIMELVTLKKDAKKAFDHFKKQRKSGKIV